MMRHPCIPVLWLAFLLVLAAPSAWPETSPQFSLPGAPALGDYQVEWLPTYVNLDPNLTRGYHSLVALRFDEALPYLRKVVQRPDVPPGLASEAWTLVGYVHLNRRQGPQAVAAFQRALALAPDNATAHFLLASEYYLDGHHERVRQHLLKAVELRPTFVSARRMLAESFADAGDYAGAVEQYQKVVDMLPGSGYYRYLLYRSQDLAGQLAQAEESLLELIKIEPSFTVNFERLGLLRLKRAQRAASPQERDALLGRAEEAFRALAAAAPQDYRSYLGLARVALERGDYGQARGFLERAGSLAGA
ncbi:MAG TPA: tetratricopeptide repeat protein, partial [Candidatus Nitrosotenuis sp.]|nr:tetratricopeptide repeat protein [Candidatus Nitrosotenuis sp.]